MEFENEDHELAVFQDVFYRDIERGWNAERFYCDHCYDDFIAEWPLAYSARNAEFQRAGIDLDTFFSGSRLCEIFTEEDFRRLIVQLRCPSCGTALCGNIWPYHLPFNIPQRFELDVDEIAKIAAAAPFLLLTHPLCSKVFELVKRLSANAQEHKISDRLYRARQIGVGVEENIPTFDFPPARHVVEGRYNHAGRPVLYVASAISTCIAEMRDANCLVMGFDLDRAIKTLDLVNLDSYDDADQELLSALCYSTLASAPSAGEGWEKPAYVFTRFLADCAAFAGFDAIKYPSTRVSEQDGTFNLVILNRSLSLATHAIRADFTAYPPSPVQ